MVLSIPIYAAYSTDRTDYYYDGTNYLTDGLESADKAINGNTPNVGDVINDYGWVHYSGTERLYKYTDDVKTLGSKSFNISIGFSAVKLDTINNNTFTGIIGFKLYDMDTTTTYLTIRAKDGGTYVGLGVASDVSTENYQYHTGANIECDENTIPRSEGWHDVIMAWNTSADANLYIDGILCHTWSGLSGFDEFHIGAWGGASDRYAIDEFWISNNERPEVADTIPPVFSSQTKNTTPYINGDVELKITITDDNQDSYKFFWNDTGSFVNDTSQTYTSGVEVSTTKTTSTAHQNICWGYWANDTGGYSNTSSLDCFTVVNTVPTVAITSPYDGDHDKVNLTVVGSCDDLDSDTVSATLNVDNGISSVTNSSVTLGVDFILTTMDMTAGGTYTWYVNCTDGYGGQIQSIARTYYLDLTPPILDVYSPKNNSWYEEADTFDLNISGEDPYIYLLNYTLFNESGDILQSNQVENISVQSYLSINDTVDISALGFNNGDKIYINISTSDLHTDSDISDLKKGKKGETEFLVNNTDDSVIYSMGAYFIEKDDKLTDTPGDVKSYFVFNDESTKINFGLNFTVIKTETKVIFNVSVQGTPLKYVEDSGYRGHLIWYPYGTDFEGTLLVNSVEKDYSVIVTVIDDNNIQIKVEPDELLAGNDIVELRFDSIFGLNIVERQYVVNVGSTSAPVLSDINCTSNPQGDTTERYDTYGDLTPTFDVTTDINSYGWISSDNSTWIICTTTGYKEHTCTHPSEQELWYGNQTVYVLFNNSYYDNKFYDVWDVFTGYYLKGTVKDDDGRTINNAIVNLMLNGSTSLIKYSATTNSSGDWDVGMPISGEIYMVMAYDSHNQTLGADAEAWIEVT